ncbi:MAG: prepilin-type N-terminal cleavage/methylation domain-containing protein [Candidatus Peribacteria bacterium]|nr:MAG: prepilin-type N-terminal cleavage/methylation domain-containing protein [Candidatus Peribacteria bacterium]
MKNYRRRGFTLIEILVAISIISILSIGASQVNWSRISEAQKIDSYRGDIKTAIEEVRNNALIGK